MKGLSKQRCTQQKHLDRVLCPRPHAGSLRVPGKDKNHTFRIVNKCLLLLRSFTVCFALGESRWKLDAEPGPGNARSPAPYGSLGIAQGWDWGRPVPTLACVDSVRYSDTVYTSFSPQKGTRALALEVRSLVSAASY